MKVKLLLLALFVSFFSSGQIAENFDGTVIGWSFSVASATTGQNCSGTKSILYTASGQFAITPSITNPNKLNCNIKRSANTTAWSINVQISAASPASQTSGPWTNVATIGSTVLQTCSAITEIDLSSYSGLRYIRFIDTRVSGAVQRGIDDVSITVAPSGFSVSYNDNASTSGTVPTDATSYASGANVTVLGNTGTLARTGYTFAGWNTLANGSGTNYSAGDTFPITANTILYAKWIPNNNTITFNGNGATSGSMSTQTIATAATANLTANGFSRIGYTFAGWATIPTGAVTYTDGASYTMGLADVTLYAVWNTIAPFITTSGTLTALSTTYGTASGNTTFTVSAGNLTSNLIITAPTGFEVSLTAASGFATSINLGASDRTNTTIYVRLAATTDFGTYSGDVVVFSTILISANVATVSSNVTKKPLTISGLSGVNKVYDGTTTAALSGTPTLIGVVSSDDVTLSGTPTSNFIDKNVGTLKAITITGYTLAGTKAANYSVSQPTGVTGNITTKSLSITTPSIASKVYDGSAVSEAVTVGTLSGFISPETVTATATGVYADANAGTGKSATVTYVLSNGTNGGLATNYSLATGSGTGDITQANPVFTTSTIAINVGGTYTLPGTNVTSTSPGALNYSITSGGFATLTGNTINGVSVGSETVTVTQVASTNYLGGSTTVSVNVTTISYNVGDYRSATSGLWNPVVVQTAVHAKWDMYNGSGWDLDVSPPATNTTSKLYIESGHTVETGSPYGNNAKIYVKSGGKFLNKHASTAHTIYVYNGGTFEFITNALRINNLFEIENGGTFIYDYSANPGSGLTLWYGNEIFHPSSNFIVKSSNSGSGNYFFPASGTAIGSSFLSPNTFDGKTAHFGNLIFDANVKDIRFATTNLNNTTVTHNNFEIRPYGIGTGSHTLLYGSVNWTIGGDFIIGQNSNDTSTTNINLTTGANTIVFNIKGNFINNSGNTLTFTSNTSANTTINLEGDLQIGLNGKLISATSTVANFNFTGIGDGTTNALTQSIDVLNAATASNINFNVNSGSYTKLINQDFALGTNSAFAVKTGGTFDFGFNGATALNLMNSGTGQVFTTQSGATLKITSKYGITKAAASALSGNVQTPVAGRTFDAAAIYHYIGKESQVSGSALPNTAANKHVIVELAADNFEFTSTNGIIRFNNPAAAIGSNFKGLEIRKGTVIADDLGSRFEDSATLGEVGNLKMTGGIYKIFTKDVQPAVSGNYDLSAGSKIIFGHTTVATTTQAIRGGTDYQYPEIEVEGKDVRYSNIGINMKSNGLFTVKENAILTNTGNVGQIVSLNDTNPATLTVKNTGIFKTEKEKGFSGIPDGINPSSSVRTNHTSGNVLVVLEPGSVVEYSRSGDQIITNATITTPSDANYQNLTISGGSGIKTLQNPTSTKINEDLTVTSSKLLLNVGEIITVKKGVKIASGGAEFEIKNKGQLIQLDETDTNTGIGFKYNRIAQADHDDYIYWSSPVDAFNLDNILGADRYFWNPLNSNSNGTVGNWNVPSTASAMQKARGYIVKVPNSFPTTGPSPLLSLFEGKPNNGSVTFDIARAAIVNSEDDRWNLTGNPYPSAIDAEQFLTANNTKINGAVWVWTHGQSPTNTVNPYYQNFVYNYYASDYVIYNKLGSSDPNTFAGKIAAGQGFMVNMLTTATTPNTISFSNAMRTDASLVPYNNADFYKTSNSNANTTVDEKHRIWIDILNTTDGQKDRILLGYATNATLGKDHFYDCFYSPNSTEVGIYTLINADPFSIQGRPLPFTDADLVPLGVSIVNAGNHKIALSKVDGLFETGQDIYLEDNLLHIIHDLKASPYSFTSAIGTFNDRFVIRYTNATLSNHEFDVSNNTVLVAVKNNQIIIKAVVDAISSIDVYDVLGREITKLNGINQKEITLSNVSDKNQALILKITLENGLVVTRKIIL